jgi:hypothetical protein
MLQRQFQLKVLGQDNSTFVATIPLSKEKSPPTFTSKLNGGQGQCVIDLDLPFDDFTEGTTIKFMNIMQLWVTDAANPLGRCIYTGYISRYEPYIDSGQEGVRVTCLGLGSLLTESYYGSQPGYAVAQTGVDPEAIAKAIIDNFNSAFGGSLISYSGTTSCVGTNVTKTYTTRKWSEALNDTVNLAGTGYWWHVHNGQFYFQAKPSLPTHTFTIGLNIISLNAPKDSEGVINEAIVTRNGGVQKQYQDTSSQSTYGTGNPATGRRTILLTDSSYDLNASDQAGNKQIADTKDAKVSCRVVVNLNYDIDSIRCGQTCQFSNFKLASSFFGSNNLQIVTMNYRGDTVELELEASQYNFGIALSQFVNS